MKKGGRQVLGTELGVLDGASSTYILLVFGSASWRWQSGAKRDCPQILHQATVWLSLTRGCSGLVGIVADPL